MNKKFDALDGLDQSLKSIDWELSLKLANNKIELAKELLNMLIDELPEVRANINQAYQDKNFRQLHQHIHKLHGASCYCGVPRLKIVAATLETTLKSSDKSVIEKLLQKLYNEIDKILADFHQGDFLQSE